MTASSSAAVRPAHGARQLRRNLRYRLLAGLAWPLGAAPRPLALWLAALYGNLAHACLPRQRRRARLHLARSFPELGSAQVAVTCRGVFLWIARAGCDFLRLAGGERERMLDRVVVEGWEHWQAARRTGRGIVIVTGHLGGWEILGAKLAQWLELETRGVVRMHVLYQPVAPAALEQAIRRVRERAGVVPLSVEKGLGPAVRALRNDQVVGLLIDRVPRGTAVVGRFFGERCRMAPGAARLALAGRADLLPVALWNEPSGGYRVRFFPALRASEGDAGEAQVVALTREMNRALEEMIRRAPEQWPWFEDRWKERPGVTLGAWPLPGVDPPVGERL